jgi:hypothetical protein
MDEAFVMKDSRAGETLWYEWTGEDFEPERDGTVFFTIGHVDIEHEVVRRALASALQRDGTAVSLGDGFRALDEALVTHGYAGVVDDAIDFAVCDVNGETREGDVVDEVHVVTWVEL